MMLVLMRVNPLSSNPVGGGRVAAQPRRPAARSKWRGATRQAARGWVELARSRAASGNALRSWSWGSPGRWYQGQPQAVQCSWLCFRTQDGNTPVKFAFLQSKGDTEFHE